eukprot:PhF_6_TR3187/c0_g1_i2/m.4575
MEALVAVGGTALILLGAFRMLTWTTAPVILSIVVSYLSLILFCHLFTIANSVIVKVIPVPALQEAWSLGAKAFHPEQVTAFHVFLFAFVIVLSHGFSKISNITENTSKYLEELQRIQQDHEAAYVANKNKKR